MKSPSSEFASMACWISPDEDESCLTIANEDDEADPF